MTRRVQYCSTCDKFLPIPGPWLCPFFECKGDPVEGVWVPLAEAREGWAEDWTGRDWIVNAWANEPRLCDDGTPMTRVLVVPVPVPPTKEEP